MAPGDKTKKSQPASYSNSHPAQSQSGKRADDHETTEACFTCKEKECHVTTVKGLKQKITNPSWVYCDSCMMWYHGMCQDMSDKDVANLHKLKDKPGVKWFCSSCTLEIEMTMKGNGDVGMTSAANNGVMNGKLGKIEDMVMKLADALSSNQAKIEDRMQKLEVSYAQAVSSNLDGVKTAQQLNSDAKAQFSQILEHQQAEYRKKNAIIYGVEPEAGRTTMEKIQELMEDVSFPTAAKPLTAKRLQTSQLNLDPSN
ncbi:hypothetical protein EB796_024203 [Bugula neritina]|uniref:PHD-type domain-containing protein n=1 Tax=Bugula neritina TaxID=10212 RepID=A0A7J7IV82_BUGNE|nr:hypothetical protein EB796_024203 [Bugula neritina]